MGCSESSTFNESSGPAVIIDVQRKQDYEAGHFPSAVNIPFNSISRDVPQMWPDKQQPIKVYSFDGRKSEKAVAILREMGYNNVLNLGGMKRAELLLSPSERGDS